MEEDHQKERTNMISYFKRLWHCQEWDKKEEAYRDEIDRLKKDYNNLCRCSNDVATNRHHLHDLCTDLMNFIVSESSNSKKLKGASHKIKAFKETQRKLDGDWQKIFDKDNNNTRLYNKMTKISADAIKSDRFQEGIIKRE